MHIEDTINECIACCKKKFCGTQALISHSIRTDIIPKDILATESGVKGEFSRGAE